MANGLPKDELFVYEDALRQGRSVVMVFAEDEAQIKMARQILEQAGAESVDAARENWWAGLRDAEAEHYATPGADFKRDEPVYRRGFEAALHPETRGKAYQEASKQLATRCTDVYGEESFRCGYERGLSYYQDQVSQDKRATSNKA
jgi:hypothetical protein